MLDQQKIMEALKSVIDPELGVSIVDLGLVYKIKVKKQKVNGKSKVSRLERGGLYDIEIEMTLTSPGCPLAPVIDQLVRSAVSGVEGVRELKLNVVWDPPWIPAMMSEEVKAEFGIED